jgi:uncharacterized protein
MYVMANSVLWFEVLGENGNALRKFFAELFGWKIGAGDLDAGFDYGLVEPGYGGIVGGIGSDRDGCKSHATFFVEVDDPTASLSKAELLGGTTVMRETYVPDLNLKLAYFADPEGHVVGLSSNAGVGGRGDAGPNAVRSFEIIGRDPGALCAFYADLFGWRMREAATFGYWMVAAGSEGVLGGIGPAKAAGQDDGPGFATFKVEVDDPQAVLANAMQLGGQSVLPVTEVPGTSLKIAYFADPERHVIGLTTGMGFRC